MGLSIGRPKRVRANPPAMVDQISIEKERLACSGLPSPKVRATMALPPVPTIKPSAPKIIIKG